MTEEESSGKRDLILWGGAVIVLFCALILLNVINDQYVQKQKFDQTTMVSHYATRVQRSAETLESTMRALGVAAQMLDQRDDQGKLQDLLNQMGRMFPMANNFQLTTNGVVAMESAGADARYPLGASLPTDPEGLVDAQRSIENGKPYIEGPLLLPGGQDGVVVRAPVYAPRGSGTGPRFWGFVQAEVTISNLLTYSGFTDLDARDFRFVLWEPDRRGSSRKLIASNCLGKAPRASEANIQLFDDHWILAMATTPRLYPNSTWVFMVLVSILAAIGYAVAISRYFRFRDTLLNGHARLHAMNQRLITLVERGNDIFESADVGMIVWSKDRTLLTWNASFEAMYPALAPNLHQGLTWKELRTLRDELGETQITNDWESVGTWIRRMPDGRAILLKRSEMPGGGRLGMHVDVTKISDASEY